MAETLTVKDVQDYLLDRNAADNPVDRDLAFSPEEIQSAMRRAANAYNSIPPYVDRIDPRQPLPFDTNIFLDATAEQLYISARAKLMRRDIDVQTGGAQISLTKPRIEHYTRLIDMHGKMWRDAAGQLKRHKNAMRAYRVFR